jgi:hypothetical protein
MFAITVVGLEPTPVFGEKFPGLLIGRHCSAAQIDRDANPDLVHDADGAIQVFGDGSDMLMEVNQKKLFPPGLRLAGGVRGHESMGCEHEKERKGQKKAVHRRNELTRFKWKAQGGKGFLAPARQVLTRPIKPTRMWALVRWIWHD